MSITSEYLVSGMHCHHCVSSVTEEVSAVSGVTDVKVDLDSGQLIVISDNEIAFESIAAAVDEAGYRVAQPGTRTPGLTITL
jgi:copper chaperone